MIRLASIVLLALAAGGCSRGNDGNAAAFNVDAVTDVPPARPTPPDKAALLPPFDPPLPGTPGGLPKDSSPMVSAPFPVDGPGAALDTVQRYYAMLERRDWANAYGLWDQSAAPTLAQFAHQQAQFSEYHANIGHPGDIDAGAGQRFITVPVQPYARDKATHQPRYFIGSVTLHRTDVDGATPEQKQWRIRSIDLKPVTR